MYIQFHTLSKHPWVLCKFLKDQNAEYFLHILTCSSLFKTISLCAKLFMLQRPNYLILDSCRIINLVYIFVRASKILSFKENFVIFSYYIGHVFWIFCFVNLESLYWKCQRILFFRLFVFDSSIQWIVQTLDFLNIRSKVKWSTSSICNIWSENRFYIVIN